MHLALGWVTNDNSSDEVDSVVKNSVKSQERGPRKRKEKNFSNRLLYSNQILVRTNQPTTTTLLVKNNRADIFIQYNLMSVERKHF